MTAFRSLSDERKRALLLVAAGLATLYALIAIVSMIKLSALTMLLFAGAQVLLLLSTACYIVVIIVTRESVSQQHFEPGEVIFRQGDMGSQVYVITNGEVEVVRDQPGAGQTVVTRLGPGEFFGEMALVHPAPRSATVRASSALDVLVMQRGPFMSLFTHLPALRRSFQRVIEERREEVRRLANPRR